MARKPLDQLSPAYRRRLEAAARKQGVPVGQVNRQAARGHGKTPERPGRAQRNPARYREYLASRTELARQVQARKNRLWNSRIRYRDTRSDEAVAVIPDLKGNTNAGHVPTIADMRAFLAMSEGEAEAWISEVGRRAKDGDHSRQQWYFMFYH